MFEFKAIPDDLSALDPEALYFLVDQYGASQVRVCHDPTGVWPV